MIGSEVAKHCEIDVSALPLSAIEELVDKGYRQINTAVVSRPGQRTATMFVTTKTITSQDIPESETSVTAQIPFAMLQAPIEEVEARLNALILVLISKGVVSEPELADALRKLKGWTG